MKEKVVITINKEMHTKQEYHNSNFAGNVHMNKNKMKSVPKHLLFSLWFSMYFKTY